MIYQAQVQIGQTFPATLFFRSDATVVVAGHQGEPAVIDSNEGISAVFDQDGFSLYEHGIGHGEEVVAGKQDYVYNHPYAIKDMPVLKAYVTQLNLELPH